MDNISALHAVEDHNFRNSRRFLDTTYYLCTGLLALYELLESLVADSKLPPEDDIVAGGLFMLGAKYYFEKAILELLRGHVTDSLAYVRSAVEKAGFADLVRRNPQMARTWAAAGNEDAYRQYRKDFKPDQAFPETDPILEKLYKRYDTASKRVHSSLHSYAAKLGIATDTVTGSIITRFAYFDIAPSDLALMFFWILDTHFGIVQVFARVFTTAIEYGQSRWDFQFNSFGTILSARKAAWTDLISQGI